MSLLTQIRCITLRTCDTLQGAFRAQSLTFSVDKFVLTRLDLVLDLTLKNIVMVVLIVVLSSTLIPHATCVIRQFYRVIHKMLYFSNNRDVVDGKKTVQLLYYLS